MRLGKGSARKRPGAGRQLTGGLLICLAPAVLTPARTLAQTETQPAGRHETTVGPGRIVCNGTFCELAVDGRTRPRIRVIVSDLPRNERKRLRKCTGVAHPCIVTVDGVTQDRPDRVMATDIHWQD